MKKHILRISIIILITIILSSIGVNFKDSIINVLYTVESILFSIIISLTVTFNFEGITDDRYLKNIRNNIEKIQYTYIAYFIISTILIMFSDYKCNLECKFISFNSNIFYASTIIFIIIFFSFEFMNLQKIKYEIIDRIIESSQKQ